MIFFISKANNFGLDGWAITRTPDILLYVVAEMEIGLNNIVSRRGCAGEMACHQTVSHRNIAVEIRKGHRGVVGQLLNQILIIDGGTIQARRSPSLQATQSKSETF